MPFKLIVSRVNEASLECEIKEGETLFILGANGTGKSSLMHRFYSENYGKARRISAHRQTWLSSNAITLSPHDKRNTENNILSHDTNANARWMEVYAEQRANISIYDLVDAENVRARSIAGAVDSNNIELAKTLSKKDAPIAIINELLRLSNMPIEIAVRENEQVVARKSSGAPFSIAELSDGERNALLIAANVLTAKEGTLVLIDEPERHLHRSIISPLLTLLFAKRPDCAFVVSTHEVMLPIDNPTARTLLVRGCTYQGKSIAAWDADFVPPATEIEGELKKDILGARRKLLFVEGTEQSLDKPLYSLIFPNVSVIAKSGCRDVEQAVSGLRAAGDLHWLAAFGIVDNDRRTQGEIDQLELKGIYALSVYSIEAIYYHPEIQRRVAERYAAVTGEDAPTRVANARRAALAVITPHVQRLSERAVEKILREKIAGYLPGRKEIAAGAPINVAVDVAAIVTEERKHLEGAIKAENLSGIVAKYPIRETAALAEISMKLGFQHREQYESAVRKLLLDDNEALVFVRSLFGALYKNLAA